MAEYITVLVEQCVMQINPDLFFDSSTLANGKKLLRYVFQEPCRNAETISILGSFLIAKVAEAKDLWHVSAVARQNGYFNAKYCADVFNLNAAKKHKIELENRRLLEQVKNHKTKYERWLKLLEFYNALKTKNHLI